MTRLLALLPVLIAFQAGAPPALAWTWPPTGRCYEHSHSKATPTPPGTIAASTSPPRRARPFARRRGRQLRRNRPGRRADGHPADGRRLLRDSGAPGNDPGGERGRSWPKERPSGRSARLETPSTRALRPPGHQAHSDAQGYLDPSPSSPARDRLRRLRPHHPPTRFPHRPLREAPKPGSPERSAGRGACRPGAGTRPAAGPGA